MLLKKSKNMMPFKNNVPLTISEVMPGPIKFGNQIGGIIHMLASEFRLRPRNGIDIIELETKGESGKGFDISEFYISGLHISKFFIYSLPFSTIQPELGSVLSPPGEAEAVD